MNNTALKQPKPLAPWYGGKANMAKIIASKLPPHKIYAELFGGMAGVLMYKSPSYIEVYNDKADSLVNLFRVVRNTEQRKKLIEALELTPHARTEWKYCNANWRLETDPIEKARMVYVVLTQGFNGQLNSGSWACGGVSAQENLARGFYNSLVNFPKVADRFKNVLIENQSAINLITRWDGLDTLFYLDPPYLADVRQSMGQYEHEMTNEEHELLLNKCLTSKAKFIISGYQSGLYSELLETKGGWIREDYSSWATSALHTVGNGLKGANSDKFKRTECLWFSPNAVSLGPLWESAV